MNMHSFVPACQVSLAELLPEMTLPAALGKTMIGGMSLDSRSIRQGDAFLALKGEQSDGTKFIPQAIAAGASVVLAEAPPTTRGDAVLVDDSIPMLRVANLKQLVSSLAGRCYGNPSQSMAVVGVTGTNGKSTCAALIAQLHELMFGPAAAMGTLGVKLGGRTWDLGMTTPDPVICQKLLAGLKTEGVELVAMEVSSHGLEQHRVDGIEFDSAVFTNLTRDHLDYHGNFEQYAQAKQKLFTMPGLKRAVINLDDAYASQMLALAQNHAEVFSYSILHFVADVHATDINYSPQGVSFQLSTPWGKAAVNSPLLGEFNVSNLLAAITTLLARGADFEQTVSAVERLKPVNGRMHRVVCESDIGVVVDYAHTPDALQQAINAVKAHTPGNLWVVFGCGGDRDKGKRRLMAEVAEELADEIVVTSDNPRTESPHKIIEEICAAFTGQHFAIEDRQNAIEFAIAKARSGDVVLLAGKGHENYQIIGEQKIPCSDFDLSVTALQKRKAQRQREVH